MPRALFLNRDDAGRQLADELSPSIGAGAGDAVVLGLPRGGVPVAAAVSARIGAPLDVLVVRKIPTPGQPELALGAVGEGGVAILNERIVATLRLPEETVDGIAARSGREVAERLERFRGGREPVPIRDRDAIIIDDGIATGATMMAAVGVARTRGCRSITIAVPVATTEAVMKIGAEVDDMVCLHTPRGFRAVGQWYADFTQVTEKEVVDLLAASGG